MNLFEAARITSYLLGLVVLVQASEFILLSIRPDFFKIWSYKNLSYALEAGLPLPKAIIRMLFSDSSFKVVVFFYFVFGVGVFVFPSFALFSALFILHLLICVRFRGTFNGGSDMMTFVLLTGLLIVTVSDKESVQKLGLIYIAVHAVYSYFKAGRIKLINLNWRNGTALPIFLKQSLFSDIRSLAIWLGGRPRLSLLLCWSVIIFEIGIVALPIMGNFKIYYFLLAVVFHFANYKCFGLNRFFWAWIAAWPSILYSISLI